MIVRQTENQSPCRSLEPKKEKMDAVRRSRTSKHWTRVLDVNPSHWTALRILRGRVRVQGLESKPVVSHLANKNLKCYCKKLSTTRKHSGSLFYLSIELSHFLVSGKDNADVPRLAPQDLHRLPQLPWGETHKIASKHNRRNQRNIQKKDGQRLARGFMIAFGHLLPAYANMLAVVGALASHASIIGELRVGKIVRHRLGCGYGSNSVACHPLPSPSIPSVCRPPTTRTNSSIGSQNESPTKHN